MSADIQRDILIVGAGAAGMYAAISAARSGASVILVDKSIVGRGGATVMAQMTVAAAIGSQTDDHWSVHLEDTLKSGRNLCDATLARVLCQEAPERIREMDAWNVGWARENGLIRQVTAPGHRQPRCVYVDFLNTGPAVSGTLRKQVIQSSGVDRLSGVTIIELKHQDQRVCGAIGIEIDTGRRVSIAAKAVVLAAGGLTRLFDRNSASLNMGGDAYALALQAGADLIDMEFVQFHPTCLYHPKAKSFLVSEALRGEGAILRDLEGRSFMEDAHPMASLAPRDIVARTIDSVMKRSGADHVVLDITHKPAPFIMDRFPNIYSTCRDFGVDITKEPIPVVPAAHYQCGGVLVDLDGRTELSGLFAVGEVASTGLHGANRLASNSLLEGLVCAHRAAQSVIRTKPEFGDITIPAWQSGDATDPDELVVVSHNWDEIRRCMWDYVGIVRTQKRLLRARKRIENLREEIRQYYWDFKVTADLLELRNIALVAELIINCALKRPESRGLHYNLDCPSLDETLAQCDTVLRRELGNTAARSIK